MSFQLLRQIGSAFKVVTIMSSVLQILTDMDERYAFELDRTGETVIPFSDTRLPFLFSKLNGEDILQIESALDELGTQFGFGVDFIISDAEFKIHVMAVSPDDDKLPIDDDDDEPIHEIENVDIVEVVTKPKAMTAHG